MATFVFSRSFLASRRFALLARPSARGISFAETGVAKTEPKPDAIAKPIAQTKKGATISQRLNAFVVGVVLSLGCGFYQLQQDIERATANIDESLRALRRDTVEAQQVIRQRVSDLESR
eukprot:CAMPEP_0184060892 /NCGR_PEP_ID=MMETSP0956-20121227/11087_1 /TAXON_ID=627963 /ORGANISM="Aplanochytrium sp, Strain PBS07" /LENGTH=118 /DNA_ID=CAMNT_0026357083 /DNA_START=53 /DNA_END=409 /DNA_ORIENTATION=-